jgi:hypothetical protein
MNSNKRFSALLAASAAVVITIWACFQLYPPSMRWAPSIHPIFQDDTEVEKISKNSLDTSNTPKNYAYATSACNINEVTVRTILSSAHRRFFTCTFVLLSALHCSVQKCCH